MTQALLAAENRSDHLLIKSPARDLANLGVLDRMDRREPVDLFISILKSFPRPLSSAHDKSNHQ